MTARFCSKVVVVTGAASGIGFAQVEAFVKEGAIVYAVDCAPCPKAWESCSAIYYVQADACNATQHEMLRDMVHVDILCNTCGRLDAFKPLLEISLHDIEDIWHHNVMSYVAMSQWALQLMQQQGHGCIINMASIAGLIAGGGGVAYTMAKHAIVGLTKQLTYDYATPHIRINAIAPGAVDTPMNAADFSQGGAIAKDVMARMPSQRYATAEEIAALTLFLASDEAQYISGSIIPIDGGWMHKSDHIND